MQLKNNAEIESVIAKAIFDRFIKYPFVFVSCARN
jgi:hypothetical protein